MLFYYPNRPILIPPDKKQILEFEKSGQYIAEHKFNGDNITIMTGTHEDYTFWNRDKTISRYQPTPEVLEELSVIPANSAVNVELMHYKTKTIKNILKAHCIMSWEGKPLLGKRWSDSRNILETLKYGKHFQLSPIYTKDFWKLFQDADGSIIEGIVIKLKEGKLKHSTSKIADVAWMLKVRKPCKKYPF